MKNVYACLIFVFVLYAAVAHGATFCHIDLASGGRLKGFLVSENTSTIVINSNDMLLTLYKEYITEIRKSEVPPSLLNQQFNNSSSSIDADYSSEEKREILRKLLKDFKKYEKKRQVSIDNNDISAAVYYAKKMRRIAHQLKVKTGDPDGVYAQEIETINLSIADLDSLFFYNRKWNQ